MDIFESDEHADETFNDISAQERDFSNSTFSHCVFQRCDFSSSDFASALFEDCTFDECNLSLIKLNDAKLQKTMFRGSKLLGINFTHCSRFALDISFEQSFITNCNFSRMKLKKTLFRCCEITDTDFPDADLSEADFTEASFRGVIFNNTNLSKALFIDARGYAINPSNNSIRHAVFSLPEAVSLVEQLGVIIR